MSFYYSKNFFWRIVYIVWPPVIRLLEFIKVHNYRQKFLLGNLSPNYNKENLVEFLLKKDFEFGIIAYKDPGEILGMRRLDTPLYQYHVRLFEDGEIRGHYEYTPEARPISHALEIGFESRDNFFKEILGEYLV